MQRRRLGVRPSSSWPSPCQGRQHTHAVWAPGYMRSPGRGSVQTPCIGKTCHISAEDWSGKPGRSEESGISWLVATCTDRGLLSGCSLSLWARRPVRPDVGAKLREAVVKGANADPFQCSSPSGPLNEGHLQTELEVTKVFLKKPLRQRQAP